MVDTEVYAPGQWRCPKCKFELIQSNLNAATGTVTAGDKTGEDCPNCHTPLWRVTWKQLATEAHSMLDQTWNQAIERSTDEATKAGDGYWNSTRNDRYSQGYVNGVLCAVQNIKALTLKAES